MKRMGMLVVSGGKKALTEMQRGTLIGTGT